MKVTHDVSGDGAEVRGSGNVQFLGTNVMFNDGIREIRRHLCTRALKRLTDVAQAMGHVPTISFLGSSVWYNPSRRS